MKACSAAKNLFFRKAPELSESGKETGSDKRQAALIDNKMPVFQHPVVSKKPQHENAAALVRRIKTSVWAGGILMIFKIVSI